MRIEPVVIALAVGIAAGVARGQDESAEQVFQSLFGDRVEAAARTTSRLDDVALAKDLLAAANEVGNQPELLRLICLQAYDLGAKHPLGYPHAIAAMRLLSEKHPAAKGEALTKLVPLQARALRTTKVSERAALGETLIDDYLTLAAIEEEAGRLPSASTHVASAIGVARTIRSKRLDELTAMQKAIATRRAVRENAARYLNLLEADPTDGDAARKLVMLYIVDLDDPGKAARYLSLVQDAALKTNVELAAKSTTDLSAEQAYAVASWYYDLAAKSAGAAKAPLQARSHDGYQRFLELADGGSLKAVEAELKVKKLASQLAAAPRPARSSTVLTGSVIRLRDQPITIEVERLRTLVADMKAYREGDVGYVSVKQRDIDRVAQTRTPSKGRLLIYVYAASPGALQLAGYMNTPTRGDDNNSFFLAVVAGKQTDAPQFDRWEGPNRPGWVWSPMKRPYPLAAGVNTIIIAGREQGSMLDKVRITPSAMSKKEQLRQQRRGLKLDRRPTRQP